MIVRVLGRPQITGGPAGPARDLRGQRQVGLLALLVASGGRPLRREAIEDELWSGGPVSETAVRVTIGRLRRVFAEVTGVDPITSGPSGYALDVAGDEVDERCFRAHLDDCRRAWAHGDVEATIRAARAGEGLWRGPAYEGVVDLPTVDSDRSRLHGARLELRDLHVAGLLIAGRSAPALDLVDLGPTDDPYRESTWALRIAALHLAGRGADALRALDRFAELLRDDLGAEPSSRMTALRASITGTSPREEVLALACPPGAGGPPATAGRVDVTTPGPGRPPPQLVGREDHLTTAKDLVDGASPRVWVVEGSPGLGKTRLAAEVRRRAAAAGLVVAQGACPRDAGVGLLVVRQLLTTLLPHAAPDVVGDPAVGPTLAFAFPELRAAVSDPRAVDGWPESGAEVAQVRVYSALERVVASLPPALVVVDDVHWVDGPLASVLGHLATRPGPVRWMFLARTADRRPGASDLLADLARGGARFDALEPLDDTSASHVVQATVPGLDRAGVDVVVARAGGNPFVLAELARHAQAGGDPARVPAGVEAVISAEVGRLGPDAASLLEVVAVAGDPHPVGPLAATAGLEGRRASIALAELVGAGLASTDEGRSRVWPSHDIVRAAVEAQLAGSDVRRIHRGLADALARAPGPGTMLRLRHVLESDHPSPDEVEEAAASTLDDPALTASPDEVARLGAQVIARAGPAATTVQGVATRLRIVSSRFAVGDVAGGQRLLAMQRPGLDALADAALDARSLLVQSGAALHHEDAHERRRRGVEVLSRLPADAAVLRTRLACWVGYTSLLLGDDAHAHEMADVADEAAKTLDDPMADSEVLVLRIAASTAFAAPPGETDRLIDRLAAVAARSSDPIPTAALVLARLEQAMRTATADDLERQVEAAATLDRPSQRVEVRWWARAARAGLELARGDLTGASASHLDAMSFGTSHGVQLAVPVALLQRYVLDWSTGEYGTFHGLLPPATADTPAALLTAHVHVCVAAGDRSRATAAADLLARPGVIGEEPTGQWAAVASLGANAAWITGHRRLGEVISDELSGRGDVGLNVGGLCYLGSLGLARGLATAAAGRVDEALDLLHAAVEREVWFGSPIWIARAARAAADLHDRRAQRGDGRAAARLRRRAEIAEAEISRPGA